MEPTCTDPLEPDWIFGPSVSFIYELHPLVLLHVVPVAPRVKRWFADSWHEPSLFHCNQLNFSLMLSLQVNRLAPWSGSPWRYSHCLHIQCSETSLKHSTWGTHSLAPLYISELLSPYSAPRRPRSEDEMLLKVPRSRLKTKGDHALTVLAPTLWDKLPLSVGSDESVPQFKKL